MGSPAEEPGHAANESPQTRVTITRTFWMGRTEVTLAQWKSVMETDLADQVRKALGDETLYKFGGKQVTLRDQWRMAVDDDPAKKIHNTAPDQPMHYVNWQEAMEFCHRLTTRERDAGRLPAGFIFSLPTEAQWEYACRAGSATATPGGPMEILGRHHAPVLDPIGWYGGNSSVGYEGPGFDTSKLKDKQYPGGLAGPRAVGTKAPNAWGLVDMLGNVWEWCRDSAGTYPGGEVSDLAGIESDPQRAERGASWLSYAAECRAASRFLDPPTIRVGNLGFRIALVPIATRPTRD